MSRYYVNDKVFFIPTKEETTIIKITPKGYGGLKEDYYVVACMPKKPVTIRALEPIISALKQDERVNECIGCRFLVNIPGPGAYCFNSNQLVRTSIVMDKRPSKCIKGTEEENQKNKGGD